MALKDLTALAGEQERLAGKFFDNLVQMPEGKGVINMRLLSDEDKPTASGGLYLVSRIHFVNGKSLHCPKELVDGPNGKVWKGNCPICEYYNKLWQDSKKQGVDPEEAEAMQTKARSIKPIERYYYNCIVRSQQNPETGDVEHNVGPKILPIGKTLHGIIIRGILGSPDDPTDKGYGDVTDEKTGRDFKLIKTVKGTGKQAYPEYIQSDFMKEASPAGTPEEISKWQKELHDLSSLRQLKTYDELLHQLRIHFGVEKDDAVGFDMNQMKPQEEVNVSSKVEVTTVETKTTAPTIPAKDEGGETLADDEFLKELQSM